MFNGFLVFPCITPDITTFYTSGSRRVPNSKARRGYSRVRGTNNGGLQLCRQRSVYLLGWLSGRGRGLLGFFGGRGRSTSPGRLGGFAGGCRPALLVGTGPPRQSNLDLRL